MVLNRAIICDIDGTLSNDENRVDLVDKEEPDIEKYHAYARFDKPNAWCAELLRLFRKDGYRLVFITGRPESMRAETLTWLTSNLDFLENEFELIMKAETDPEDTVEFKRHRFRADVLPVYDVEFALEDRAALANMWRSEGVPCLQCLDRE